MKFFIFLLIIPLLASAQTYVGDPTQSLPYTVRQEGRLLSLRLVLGEPVKLFVIGKEEAKLDLSTLKLTVRRLKPYPGKILSLNKYGDYYEIEKPMLMGAKSEIEVVTNLKGKKETFHFRVSEKSNPK